MGDAIGSTIIAAIDPAVVRASLPGIPPIRRSARIFAPLRRAVA